MEIGIALCNIPHNSEHWPEYIPLCLNEVLPFDILPGMQSNLKFSPTIVSECRTSAAVPVIFNLRDLINKIYEFTSIAQTSPII